MNKITITNTFEKNKLIIGFDFHDGLIPFPPFELTTNGDVELNHVVIKLTDLLEMNREIVFSFQGIEEPSEDKPKLILIKSTLEEIYNGFNKNILKEIENPFEIGDNLDDEIL